MVAVDAFIGLWSPPAAFALGVLTILTLLISEWMSSQIFVDHEKFSVNDEISHHHIRATFASLEMPNYWIWYDGSSIYDLLKAQRERHVEFIIITAYNAAWSTSVVGCFNFVFTMMLAIRAFNFNQTFWRRWFSPIICIIAFLADMIEDMLLIQCALSYPKEAVLVEYIVSWCSFIKYCSWFVILLWNLSMGFLIVVKPPEHLNKE